MAKFLPGQSGNPKGRPVGARVKLSEDFLNDLLKVWEEGGLGILKAAAVNDPVAFSSMVAKLLPREHVHEIGENLADALRRLAGRADPALPQEPADLRDGGIAGHA